MTILLSSPRLGRLARLAAIGLLAAGCSSNPDKADRPENPFKTAQEGPGGTKSQLSDRELRQQASELYRHARESLNNSDYLVAITRYDALIARYPFSDYSTQAELEKIYAQYKSLHADEAVTAADRFLRAHPRHPAADYVMYLKGVTDFDRDQGVLETVMPSTSKRDIGNQRRAFEDFALLVQRYPNSKYIGDARRRMMYSRNRIADHELSVAEFYVTRGAYVAAAKRATDIISEYPGAPATADALKILQRSYVRIGLEQDAKDTAAVIAMNSDKVEYTTAPKAGTVTAVETPAPLAQANAQTNGVAPDDQQPAPSHGFMSRFASIFGILDTTKPEHQRTYVIGGDTAAAPANATGATGSTDAAGAAAAGTVAAGGTAAAAKPNTITSNVSLTVEYPPAATDDAPQAKPKDAPAKPAEQTQQAGPQPEKPGFLTWFAGLFSFLDFGKHDEPAPAPPQQPADAKSGASTNADTTK